MKRKNLMKEEEVKIEEKVVVKDELPKVMRDTIKKEEKDKKKRFSPFVLQTKQGADISYPEIN